MTQKQKKFPTHALTRTSPKPGPFIGRCTRCGIDGLGPTSCFEPCENIKAMTNNDALMRSIIGWNDS